MTARDAAEAGAKDVLAAEKAAQKQAAPTVLAFKRFVLLTFASNAQVLADFGLTPPQARAPLSTEQRAARTAKAKANARSAWDDEQEAEARRQRQRDGRHRVAHHCADPGPAGETGFSGDACTASRTAGRDRSERAPRGRRHEVVAASYGLL